jgi:D-serine deaminase-like pyridoxal phosphate-dependent protein
MNFRELSTPALAVDLGVLERNLDRMAKSCRDQGVGLRPHTKTHKTPEVARLQMDRGARGLTVAKVGEAEVMAQAGLDDILVAYPVFGRRNFPASPASMAQASVCWWSSTWDFTAAALSPALSASSWRGR